MHHREVGQQVGCNLRPFEGLVDDADVRRAHAWQQCGDRADNQAGRRLHVECFRINVKHREERPHRRAELVGDRKCQRNADRRADARDGERFAEYQQREMARSETERF